MIASNSLTSVGITAGCKRRARLWRFVRIVACAVLVLSVAPLGAQDRTSRLLVAGDSRDTLPSDTSCHVNLCRVLTIDDVEVPALEEGQLVAVYVKDGDFVQKGAVLALVDDQQARLEKVAAEKQMEAARLRADSDIDVRFAEASLDVADAELQQGLELNAVRPNAISASEIRRRQLAKYRAELEVQKSRLDLKVAKMNVEVSRASLDLAEEKIRRRRIVSPIDGIVMPIYRGAEDQRVCQVGHWVRAGEPVLRVIRMDRLHVEGLVSADDYSPADIDGRPVTVHAQLARGRQVDFRGQVVFVSPIVDKRNQYRVRAEVENRTEQGQWLLRPGTTASMTIHLK